MKHLLVLASGRGSDFQAISDHIQLGILQGIEIQHLICNHPGAPVVSRARNAGVDVIEIPGIHGTKYSSPEEREKARIEFDQNCLAAVRKDSIDLVILAGFDQLMSREFVSSYPDKILNIHPAYDLQKYGGKNMVGKKVHSLVIQNKEKYSGCTVHIVTTELDQGPPILKKKVQVLPDDTPESLERRILLWEHLIYPKAIQMYIDSRVSGDDLNADQKLASWETQWNERQRKYILEHRQELSEILPQDEDTCLAE
jgi:phosphoribosylglycinamide formyltransferase-1